MFSKLFKLAPRFKFDKAVDRYGTDGKNHDVRVIKDHSFPLVPDSIDSVDHSYIDCNYLYSLIGDGVSFVTRANSDIKCDIFGQHEEPKVKGGIKRRDVSLSRLYAEEDYPDELRRIEFYDEERDKKFVFMTNNFKLAASSGKR